MLNLRRLAALVLGLLLVQLPAARADGSCGAPHGGPEAHATVMADMSPTSACEDCEPPADRGPCDESHAMHCIVAGACSALAAESNTVPLTAAVSTGQLPGVPVEAPSTLHQGPETPPPRA